MTVLEAIHVEPFFSEASQNEKNKIKEVNFRTDTACRFARYIEDIFVLGKNKRSNESV